MILLDTHVAMWVDQSPSRIGGSARDAMAAEARVCFSAVLSMEVTIKRMLGKMVAPGDLPVRLVDAGLEELSLTSQHAAAMEEFPALIRHDPFDRLYVAQARAENARLVTGDRFLLALGHDWIVDARS